MHIITIGLVTFFFYDRSVGFPGAKHHNKSLIWGSLLDVSCVSVIIAKKRLENVPNPVVGDGARCFFYVQKNAPNLVVGGGA